MNSIQNMHTPKGLELRCIWSKRKKCYWGIWAVVLMFFCTGIVEAFAQTDYGVRFVRIRYDTPGGEERNWRRFGGPTWSHDYPKAELNLHLALIRTTEIFVEGDPVVLRLSDNRIFEHPILYICEPGYWTLEDEEVGNLREYLSRGGFVLFDDFGNEDELQQLQSQMERVFPGIEPREIPPDHPVWTVFYDVDPIEAPALVGGRGYFTKYDDKYLAYFDENGRIVALACYNQDIGDGWEWPERSFGEASTITFQMGINFFIYALTH